MRPPMRNCRARTSTTWWRWRAGGSRPGAGGAARAIAVESALAGASAITIVNRDPARGGELVALINEKTPAVAYLAVWERTVTVDEDAARVMVFAAPLCAVPDTSAEP